MSDFGVLAATAAQLAGELASWGTKHRSTTDPPAERITIAGLPQSEERPLDLVDAENLLAQFDARVVDPDLRAATRSRFASRHYADAVESGIKALNDCVRRRTGKIEDGDELMTSVFSVKQPMLRINRLKSKTDLSEQRGHMMLCQGVVAAWRNPRAHTLMEDSPARTLLMLEMIDDLVAVTKRATRTRNRTPEP